MKTTLIGCIGLSLLVIAPAALAKEKAAKSETMTINAISTSGVGADIGTVTLSDSAKGLVVTPKLKGLPPGDHGFHIHAKADCAAADKDGVMTAGQAAGGHFDPANTSKHEGPMGQGHEGDMPILKVAADGTATEAVTVPRMKLADAHGHAIMIHEGGDNYSDTPKPLGGGGARIACGVVK